MQNQKLEALRILKRASTAGIVPPMIQAPIPAPDPNQGAINGNTSATANHDATIQQKAKSPETTLPPAGSVPSRDGIPRQVNGPTASGGSNPASSGFKLRTGSTMGAQKLAAEVLNINEAATGGVPAVGGAQMNQMAGQIPGQQQAINNAEQQQQVSPEVDQNVLRKMQYKWKDKMQKLQQSRQKIDLQEQQAKAEMDLEHEQLRQAEQLKAEQKAFDAQVKQQQQMDKAQSMMPQFPLGQPQQKMANMDKQANPLRAIATALKNSKYLKDPLGRAAKHTAATAKQRARLHGRAAKLSEDIQDDALTKANRAMQTAEVGVKPKQPFRTEDLVGMLKERQRMMAHMAEQNRLNAQAAQQSALAARNQKITGGAAGAAAGGAYVGHKVSEGQDRLPGQHKPQRAGAVNVLRHMVAPRADVEAQNYGSDAPTKADRYMARPGDVLGKPRSRELTEKATRPVHFGKAKPAPKTNPLDKEGAANNFEGQKVARRKVDGERARATLNNILDNIVKPSLNKGE